MNELKGKRILILQQRSWGVTIGHFLAQKLQQEEGCKLAAITLKRTTDIFTREQKEVSYELIENNDAIMEDPAKYLAGDRYTMEEICADLGIDTIWPIITTLRNHVRTYGEKYYYSYRQNVPDEETLLYVMAFYKLIKKYFDEFNPDVILALNYVALPHIMLNLYAKRRGVTMLAFTDCKVRGQYIFTTGYRDDGGAFYDRVDELNQGKADSMHRGAAKAYIDEFRKNFKQPHNAITGREKQTILGKLKHHLRPYVHVYRFFTLKNPKINRLSNFGVTIDYRPPHIILRDHYVHERNTRDAIKFPYRSLDEVKNFAYFPLQFQPESNIDTASPFYNNQLDLARQLALALPGDITLVIKEHPAMVGLRSRSFYEKLRRTPNIKLIDPYISSEAVLRRAAIVLSINGTAIAEAAFLNKPAIQVGDLGTTQKLPNVIRHTDLTTLPAKIREVLEQTFSGEVYEKRLENFVSAAYDTGFPIEYITEWETERRNESAVWELYKKELIALFQKAHLA